jgi:putative phosphoesterase
VKTMKIAIITDIHGNSPALKSVFSDIDSRGDIEHIYCLGDMIAIGPDSNEVIEEIFSRNNISAISGNHEEAVLSLLKGKGTLPGHEQAAKHHEWIGKHLKKESINILQELPKSLEIEIEGHNLLMIHYHMKDNKLESIEKEPTGLKLDSRYEGSLYDLVCFGHHHPVHLFKTNKRIYLNPGALGCNDHPKARYAIVELQKNNLNVNLNEIVYNNKEFLKSYEKLEVPDREFILKIFHGDQLEGILKDGSNIS